MNLLKGMLFGICSICPGLSGGLLAVQLGDYNKIISIINLKQYNKTNIIYLINIVIGFMLGTIFFSSIISHLFENYTKIFNIVIIFISLIILLIYIYNSNISLFSVLIMTVISFILFILTHIIDVSSITYNIYVLFLISSIVFSFSKVIPGLSGTSILINIGFYKYLLKFFSNPFILFDNIFLWLMFWIVFVLVTYFLIKFLYVNNEFLKRIVIVIMFINILLLVF